MADETDQTKDLIDQLRYELRKEFLRRITLSVVGGSIGVFALAAVGAWALLKPQIIKELGISQFPHSAVVAFDGGPYEKKEQTSGHLNGCPDGWVRFRQAEGRFIIGSDANEQLVGKYVLRKTGGEEEVELSTDEMPMHNHFTPDNNGRKGTAVVVVNQIVGGGDNVTNEYHTQRGSGGPILNERYSQYTGGGPDASPGNSNAHNNMPPYISLYFCKKEQSG